MYIIYSPKQGKQVVRRISNDETIAALIKTKDGHVGCWSCGGRVRCLSANSMICVECGARMEIGHGRSVKLSITADGAIVSRVALAGGEPQNVGVMGNGDVVIFPEPGSSDFSVDDHDPIGFTPLDLLLDTAARRSKTRARA